MPPSSSLGILYEVVRQKYNLSVVFIYEIVKAYYECSSKVHHVRSALFVWPCRSSSASCVESLKYLSVSFRRCRCCIISSSTVRLNRCLLTRALVRTASSHLQFSKRELCCPYPSRIRRLRLTVTKTSSHLPQHSKRATPHENAKAINNRYVERQRFATRILTKRIRATYQKNPKEMSLSGNNKLAKVAAATAVLAATAEVCKCTTPPPPHL